jgi:hypothetical protein
VAPSERRRAIDADVEVDRAARAKRFFRIRVAVLLLALMLVVIYAVSSSLLRQARTDWARTLSVAVVLVAAGPLDPAAIAALHTRARVLETALADEEHRYLPAGPKPFVFTVLGPIVAPSPPPALGSDSTLDLLAYTWRRWRWVRAVDAAAATSAGAWDSRIYVVARPPTLDRERFVEGASEQGGRVGIVEVELDADTVDWALFATAHELLHTLGATDKYDAAGNALAPQGLAEPSLSPRYPQRFAEVMTRGRALSPTVDEAPDALGQLRVGGWTAAEIGWIVPKK